MHIQFKDIEITNFRSIGNIKVDLHDQGIVQVKGINQYEQISKSNGSGKSSIFEAIIFALYEETSTGSKEVENRIINNGYDIKLNLFIDNIPYTIHRYKNGSKTNVELLQGDSDISARNKTDTNKLIEQLIGINKEIFLDSIYLSQGLNTNLSVLSPTARKERLEILTNTEQDIEYLRVRLKNKDTELTNRVEQIVLDINKNVTIKEMLEKDLPDLTEKLSSLKQKAINLRTKEEINKAISEQEDLILSLDKDINNINEILQDLDNQSEKITPKQEELTEFKTSIETQLQDNQLKYNQITNDIELEKSKLSSELRILHSLQSDYTDLEKSEVCPTCGRPYDDIDTEHLKLQLTKKSDEIHKQEDIIEQIQQVIEKFKQNQQEIEKDIIVIKSKLKSSVDELSIIEDEIVQIENKKKDIEYEKLNTIPHKKELCYKQIKMLQEELQTTTVWDEIDTIQINLEEIQKEIEKQNALINTSTEIKNKLDLDSAVVNDMLKLVTKEFRMYLLESIIAYMNNKLKDYSTKLFSNPQDIIQLEQTDTRINIKLGEAMYESLSGGEKTKVDISLLLAQKSLAQMIGNISSNIIILDEILKYCDTTAEEKIIELVLNELNTIESIYIISHKEILVGYDKELVVVKDEKGVSGLR
nr:MAG TPA: STRUCTURAL MAINTENANCE OF CHROMOSOMES PROTEIN [Caudoviricetes sp.]